ncbi:MAG: helix-turn-helix transcriptional regulator [Candidatus Shapirobacteria bacterium]|nr:helix-turn-helix transcriptional regulator [Candidatus Shapirobacteria bacterium]MDD4410727.1 helix-turn-helix transcriptional regulator [Candidatus Shapirobacteria bacterium]
MNEVLALSKAINRARKLAKLSQKELGDRLSISDKTISAYESGRAIPPIPTLKRISEITNQPIGMFFQNDENEVNLTNLKLNSILEELDKIKKYLSIE